ncbi:MAG TPA: HD-GYP domain-containing protein, partial [Actinomycetota bacterium]|nr:HD-GYP domain-containing protein [Actinomycetota bacterium]
RRSPGERLVALPRLGGGSTWLDALAATLALLVLPAFPFVAFRLVTGRAIHAAVAWVLIAALGCLTATIGKRWWSRRRRSQELTFHELMLWTWVRRRRAISKMEKIERSLGLDRAGTPTRHLDDAKKRLLKTLHALNDALETRDPYRRGHSGRVERHARRIGSELGCSEEELADLTIAAELHDLGKIRVPDIILRKAGPLSDDEWTVMKSHPAIGAQVVSVIRSARVVRAVRHHHERWDGRGYPDGLLGREIPLDARIIAVADTFDAITSTRPYRPRSERARAVRILRKEAGKQFDPEVVAAFLASLPQPRRLALTRER